MKQYIITAMFDEVLHYFCFVFAFCLVSLHSINVSVKYNGGLLPDIILLTSTAINCPMILIILLSQI